MTTPSKDISAARTIGRLGGKILQLFTVGLPALCTQLLKVAAAAATLLGALAQAALIVAGCALLILLIVALA